MPIYFNTLLREAGFPLCDVRLVRHKDHRTDPGRTIYDLWRDDPQAFEVYQSTQGFDGRPKLNAPYWAVFLGTPEGKTMFVGVYGVRYQGRLKENRPMPHREGGVDRAGTCDDYELTPKSALEDLRGRLFIEWGKGKRAWVQYAADHDKPITELREKAVRRAGTGRTPANSSERGQRPSASLRLADRRRR